MMDTKMHLDRSRTGHHKKRKLNGSSFLHPNGSSPMSGGDYFQNVTTCLSPTTGSIIEDYGCTNIQIQDFRGRMNLPNKKDGAILSSNLQQFGFENLTLPPRYHRGTGSTTA